MDKDSINNTAYSTEKLCKKLPSCAIAKNFGYENFDMYCSGKPANCPQNKIRVDDFAESVNVIDTLLLGGKL